MTTSDTLSCEGVAVTLKALLALRGKKAWEEYSSESDSEMMHSVPCSKEGNVGSDVKRCEGCGRMSEETYKCLLFHFMSITRVRWQRLYEDSALKAWLGEAAPLY